MESLIYKLKKNNIKINVVNDQLKLEIPEGFDPTEILHEVRANKQELTEFIKKIKGGDRGFDKIEPCEKKDYYTLSSVQKRLYFLYQLDNTSMAYNLPQAVLLEGDLDKDKLKRIFNELVQRHESLRTSLIVIDNEPVQKILENVNLHVEHYRSTREKAPEIVKNFVRPFDLAHGPLIRVGLIESEEIQEGPQQHILLVDMHHIVSDGTSMSILVKEFMALYNDQQLPALKLQYKDYAEWQQSEKRRQEVAKQKEFWSKEFAEEVKPLNLPVDFKRPLMRSNAGAYYGFTINTFEVKELKAIAEQESTTLFIVLLSLYNILLAKLSNQEDVVVGTPIAGRHHNDLENMIGMFVPSLPLRNYPKGNYTFREFLDTLKIKIPSCFDNQSYEYEELLEELKIERNISYNPLFDFMFSLQNFEKKDLNISGLAIKSLPSGHIAALFDMTFVATLEKGNLGFGINYSTELFKEETIKRFAGYFKKIVSAIVTNREIRLADIDIIPHDEKAKVLNEFNHPEIPRPDNITLTSLLEIQAEKEPTGQALSFKDASVTYGELNTKVNKLAHYLISNKNVKPEDKIGLYFDRSPELIVAMLAILKSGGTYICLDPEYPAERINAIVGNSGMRYVITDQHEDLVLNNNAIEIIDVNRDQLIMETMSGGNPDVRVRGTDAAYVIYTSGSTGEPKGVIIEHGSMLDYAITFKDYFNITDNDRVIQQSSFSFDTVVEEIFPALISGGEVIIMPEGGRDIYALVETIQNKKATVLSTTPVVLNILNGYAEALESLRIIISGGDLLLPSHINKLTGKYTLYNTYGPSESTVCITYNKIDKLEDASCIGKPIDNRQVYIMNQTGKLCPIGVPGELCVSGKGLARGYLGDERLTREKFVDNPVIPGKTMYRTGDLARWLPNGKIEFLGRVDDQVKIRGIRIELKEIQSHLLNHTAIREAVVITKGDEMEKHLVAYYVADEPIEVADLRDFLKESLPNHMIPAYFVHLEKIPLTANSSKLDKKALPAPEIIVAENYEPAFGETEEKLVGLWSEILKIDASKLSVTRSFFEMGGHSLKAAFLINRLRKELSIDVPLKEVFKNQNIRALGEYIDNAVKSSYKAIEKAPEKEYYALSAAQRRLYFLYEFDRESLAYNLPQVVKLEGTIDKEKLNRAFSKLVQRHESLRTYFEVVDDEPVQKISEVSDFSISCYASTEDAAPGLIKDFIRPFDLSQSPLIRVGLITTAPDQHILMVDLHHIITDGISQEILVRDFMSLYNDLEMPELNLQYKDYAEWQQSSDQQERVARQKAFWLEQFSEPVTPLDLPMDFNRKSFNNYKGDNFRFNLDHEEADRLKSMAEQENATMFMVLLSAFNILLSKLSSQEDVTVGTTVAGREHDDVENMIGMFVNTLALRHYPKKELTYRDFLQEVKHRTLACFDNQAYPYEELVDELKVPRDTSRNPLFDVMFGFLNMEGSGLKMNELTLKPYSTEHAVAKFDLTLMAAATGDQVFLELGYATQLFKRETIERFATYFKRIISAVAANPDVKIGEVNMLSDKEKDMLLNGFNATSVEYPHSESLMNQFHKQVQKTPENVAIIYRDQELTYAEVNIKSNQIATYLQRQGVHKGAVVGLAMGKSVELIISMIGILKAGAVYLPLDPDHPEERNAGIIKESNMVLMLTAGDELKRYKKYVGLVDIRDNNIWSGNPENVCVPVDGNSLVYIIYTSGSTGVPKGVMIKNQAVINLICSQKRFFGITGEDRILQFSTVIFDASVEQIWLALLSGAALVLPDKEIVSDNTIFEDYLIRHKVTHLHATPSFLDTVELNRPNSLKRVVSGGEECKKHTAQKYCTRYAFYNEYGPTETTVTSTISHIKADTADQLSIGKPIDNTTIYILDSQQLPVPVGAKGELYIGGAGVAAGYLNNEALSRERFINNPFKSGTLMYKTGDLARWLPDGNIQYLGRIDNQVKIRGFRIELGEIEHQLAAHEDVKDAAVLVKEREGEKYLVGYYVAEQEIDPSLLKNYLLDKLPEYMIPARFVWLENMPVNATGKVDRRNLPEPTSLTKTYEAPVTEMEHSLVEIWSQVLKLEKDQISVTENFFDLGGNSLSAMTVVNKINKTFQIGFTLRELFFSPTVKAVSDNIAARKWLDDDVSESNAVTKEVLI